MGAGFEFTSDDFILFSTIAGQAPLARQKILSIFHHVANQHSFPALDLFQKCQHGELDAPRPWIKPGNHPYVCSSFIDL